MLEQNYEYDLLEPEKLLRKYVGRDVTLVRTRTDHGETRRGRSDGNTPQRQWRTGVAHRRRDRDRPPADQSGTQSCPENLYTHPTLIWTLNNAGAATQRVEASYLAGKLSWNADYVLTVRATTRRRSGRLGHVRQRQRHGVPERKAPTRGRQSEPRASDMLARDGIDCEGRADGGRRDVAGIIFRLSPLHARPKDDGQQQRDETGQHADGHRRPGSQALRRRRPIPLLPDHPAPGLADQGQVQVYYEFKNEESAGLGMPMPAGTVRVYQADSKGGVQFVGEDRIGHTPKDETLNLKIGNAFDVVCERKQSDFEKIAPNVYEIEYKITLRNHKAMPITVDVNEPIGGTWRMLQSSHQWTKTDAWAARSRCRSQPMAPPCSRIACA